MNRAPKIKKEEREGKEKKNDHTSNKISKRYFTPHRPDKTICQTLGKTKELETVQTNKAHPFDATV